MLKRALAGLLERFSSVSLARSSLIYDWRRYLAALLAVSFSGLLVAIQLGLLFGMFGTVSNYIEESGADVWVGYPDTKSVDLGRNISTRNEVHLHMHPGVRRVEKMLLGMGDWRRDDGAMIMTYITGVDTRPDGMGLARVISPDMRLALDEPGAVVVDESDIARLRAEVGSTVEINGKRAKVVGLTSGMRAIGAANVFCSLSTAEDFGLTTSKGDVETTYYLVRARDPRDVDALLDDLIRSAPPGSFSAWKSDDFAVRSQLYWLLETGSGVGVGFSSLLGLLVGAVITSQTLKGAIMSSLKEYATLRALGIPLNALRAVVVEQSFWIGVVGLVLTAAGLSFTAVAAEALHVALLFPWWSLAGTGVLVLGLAVGSGMAALRPLYRVDPAELLR